MHNRLRSAGSRILELTKLVKDLEDDNRRVSKIVNILEGRILILKLNAPTKDQQSTQDLNEPFDSPGSLFNDVKPDTKPEPASSPQYTCMMANAEEGSDDEERVLNATSDHTPFHPSEFDVEEDNREGMQYYPLLESEWDSSRNCHRRDFYLDLEKRKDMAHLASSGLRHQVQVSRRRNRCLHAEGSHQQDSGNSWYDRS